MSLFGGVQLPDKPDPNNILLLDSLQMPLLRQMSRYGFRIDMDHFAGLSSRLNVRMSELRQLITEEIPDDALDRFVDLADSSNLEDVDGEADSEPDGSEDPDSGLLNVDSSEKIAALLYDVLRLHLGGDVRIKKTKSGRLSTGKKTLEQLKRDHPIVPLILEYRENSKLDGTYARAMPRQARLHPKGEGCPVCSRSRRASPSRPR